MPRQFRRTRVISIRLSDEEYDQLQVLCAARGADSISELARRAMKMLARSESLNGDSRPDDRYETIRARVTILDREVDRLSQMMGLARLEAAEQ